MRMLKCLAAAGAIAALLQTAHACDDFEEEMALAAAREAARVAEAQREPQARAPATGTASTEPPVIAATRTEDTVRR